MHFIVNVRNSLISKNGRQTHLGQIIAGFKMGCNRRNRLLRTNNPTTLHAHHHTVDTLVSPSALHGFLIREHALPTSDTQQWQAVIADY